MKIQGNRNPFVDGKYQAAAAFVHKARDLFVLGAGQSVGGVYEQNGNI